MKASELKAKFGRDLSSLGRELSALEAERIKLALPAHSGDEAAMLRVVDLRSDIGTKRAELKDLEQALADIDPAVTAEQATERLRRREQLLGHYVTACDNVMARMSEIDATLLQLAQLFQAAAEPLERTRHLAVALMVPFGGGSGVGHQALQRMLVAQRVGIKSVGDLVEIALQDLHVLTRQTAPFPLRSDTKLSEAMAHSLAGVNKRLVEVVAEDRAAAAHAGAVLEPVAA